MCASANKERGRRWLRLPRGPTSPPPPGSRCAGLDKARVCVRASARARERKTELSRSFLLRKTSPVDGIAEELRHNLRAALECDGVLRLGRGRHGVSRGAGRAAPSPRADNQREATSCLTRPWSLGTPGVEQPCAWRGWYEERDSSLKLCVVVPRTNPRRPQRNKKTRDAPTPPPRTAPPLQALPSRPRPRLRTPASWPQAGRPPLQAQPRARTGAGA